MKGGIVSLASGSLLKESAMDRHAIEAILAPISGATFASLDTQTEVKLTGGKKNPLQGRVVKRCLGNRVMLFTNKYSSAYDNMVKRRLEQAGLDPAGFNAGALPWGTRVPNSPFIENNGKLYLQTVFLKAGDIKYFERSDCVDRSYIPINKEAITGLNEKTGSEHQGLERSRQVIVRTYDINSIQAIRCFGDELESDSKPDLGLWSR
jgi:hypothetical protein